MICYKSDDYEVLRLSEEQYKNFVDTRVIEDE